MGWTFFWIICAVFGIVGGILGSSVNKGRLGFLLGFFLRADRLGNRTAVT